MMREDGDAQKTKSGTPKQEEVHERGRRMEDVKEGILGYRKKNKRKKQNTLNHQVHNGLIQIYKRLQNHKVR